MLKNTTLRIFVIFTVIGLLVYSHTLDNKFIGDDESQVERNVAIRSIHNIPSFFLGGTFYSSDESLIGIYYKPMMVATFALISTFLGGDSFAYHMVQLLLHIINTCLLYIVFIKYFKNSLAFILSLVFLIHPANSESVLYISGMQESLYFFFGVSGFLVLSYYESVRIYVLGSVLLLLSLFSKETGILFIALSFLDVLLFDRKKIRVLSLYLVLPIVIYSLMRINALGFLSVPNSSQIAQLSLGKRLINIPPIWLFYFKQFFLPFELAYVYRWAYSTVTLEHFFIPLSIVLLIISLILIYMKYLQNTKSKYFSTYVYFSAILVGGLLFHSQIFPLYFTVSERWMYLPIVGMLGMVGVVIANQKVDLKTPTSLVLITVFVLMLFTRTFQRGYDWRDQLTLSLKDSTVIEHQDYTGQDYIASDLLKKGQLDEAFVYSKRSVEMFPYFTNLNTMGLIYINQGEYEKAYESLVSGLEYGKYDALYENIGSLSILYGDPRDYLDILKEGVRTFPQDAKLWKLLAIAQYRSGLRDDAIRSIVKARRIQSNDSIEYVYEIIMSNKQMNLIVNTIPES